MGEVKDAILASGLAVVNGLVGIVQEMRAKRRLDRIALLGRAKATVIRDGRERAIDPDEIVVGDVLRRRGRATRSSSTARVVGDGRGRGRRVAADRRGRPDPQAAGRRGLLRQLLRLGDRRATRRRRSGRRAWRRRSRPAPAPIKVPLTPLQQNSQPDHPAAAGDRRFLPGADPARRDCIWDYPFHDTVLAAAVVLGLVPSGLFLMITVAYAMGAVRLAAQDALVQQANAVESLSNVDVLCMDKTGTLTANRLRWPRCGRSAARRGELRRMLGDFARSASGGTKTSEAIAAACAGDSARRSPTRSPSPRRASGARWRSTASEVRGVFVLGAPEMLGAAGSRDGAGSDAAGGLGRAGAAGAALRPRAARPSPLQDAAASRACRRSCAGCLARLHRRAAAEQPGDAGGVRQGRDHAQDHLRRQPGDGRRAGPAGRASGGR